MANVLVRSAKAAAQRNEKRKKDAIVSGAKATAYSLNEQKEQEKKADQGYHPGSPSGRAKAEKKQSDYAIKLGQAMDTGASDWFVQQAGGINDAQRGANPGGLKAPGRRTDRNDKPIDRAVTEQIHNKHQESVDNVLAWQSKKAAESQAKMEGLKEGLTPFEKWRLDLGYTAAQMALDAGTSAVMGGGGIPFKASMGLRTYGSSYEQAKSAGATDQQASFYGIANAALQVGTESMTSVGGALKKTMGKGIIDVEKLLKIGTKDVVKSTAGRELLQAVAQFGLTSSMEGAEEFVAGMIEPILRKYIYSNEELDLGEMLKSSLYDASLGAALGAGFGMVDVGSSINSGKLLNNNDTVTALVDSGLASGEDTQSYKIAKSVAKRMAKGMEPTNLELNRLRSENSKAIEEEQAREEKIRNATDRVISQKVGPEYASRDMDIDEQHQYYEALQEQGYPAEAPVAVREYGKVRNELFAIMEPKAQAIGREKDPELNNDLTAISRIIMGQGTAEDITRMYPANAMAREVFTEYTGMELPASNMETRAVLLDFTENKRVALADIEKNPGKVMLREDVLSAYERAGRMGTPIEAMDEKYSGILSEAEAKQAYEKGSKITHEAEKGPVVQKKEKNRSADRVGSRTGFTDEASKPVSKTVSKALDTAGKFLGLQIVRVDEISATVGGKKMIANGSYENGVLKISSNAANPLEVVFSHELWHHLKQKAPKQAKALEDFVKKVMFEDDPVKFGAEMKRYAKLYGNNDEDFLMEEIMADSLKELMADPELITQLATESPTLAQKILDFLKQFIEAIKSLYTGKDYGQLYADLGIKEEAVAMLADAIKAARANTNAMDSETKYQLVGRDEEGIEIYETSSGTKSLTYKERRRTAINLLTDQFAGRTAKFIKNNQTYYAKFSADDMKKNLFGDLQSSSKGKNAKVNISADNNYVELVEHAKYLDNEPETGKKGKGHEDVTDWDYFAKEVVADGIYYNVLINVKRKPDGEYVYFTRLNENLQKINKTPARISPVYKNKRRITLSEEVLSDANISPSDEDVKRFSLSEAVEAKGGLIAAHNLNEGSLMESLRLGGFPMPSIAVTTAEMGHSNFGPVSVLFGPETIDPAKADNRVYSGDAWTPTFPQVGYKFNVNKIEEIQDRFMGYFGARDPYRLESKLDPDNIQNRIGKGDNSVFDVIRNDDGIMAAFLEESGIPYEKAYREKQYLEDPVVNEAVIEKYGIEKLRAWRNTNYAELEAEGAIKDLMDTINNAYEELYAKATGRRIRVYSEDNFGFGKFDPTVRDIVKYYNEGRSKELDTYKTRDNIKAAIENHMDEYEAWGLETFDGTIIQKGVRDPKVELFTRAGSRRGFDSLYMEYTLENIVKAMKAEPENGNQAFGITAGFLKGKIARRFKTIQDIKQNVDLLKEDATVESAYEELDNAISSIVHDMADKYISEHPDENQFFVYDEAAAVIVEAAESARTPAAIKKVLDQYNRRMESNDQIVNDIVDLFNAAIDLPVRLFEAKPRRVVGLDEVRLVVLPEGTSQNTITALEQKNIPYDTYNSEDEQDRINKVNSHEEVRWSLTDSEGVVLTPEQKEYFKDSQIRDEQGRLLLLYRSADGGRTVWDGRGKGTWAEGIFLTDSNEIARAYTFSRDPEVIQVYANGKHPFVIDAQGKHYQQIPIPESAPQSLKDWFWYDGTADADNLPRWAFQNGHDSVIIKNVREGIGGYPATDVILKDSNQIKLADNSAPTDDPDIRYSFDGTAAYTEERLKDLYLAYGSPDHKDYAKAYVTYMSPEEFLSLTSPKWYRPILEKEVARDMPNGLDINILSNNRKSGEMTLTVDFKTGRVESHEGRHRMILLQKAGINRVPVTLFTWDKDGRYNRDKIENMTLKGQWAGKSDKGRALYSPGKVTITGTYPLSERYKDTVRDLFLHPAEVRFSLQTEQDETRVKIRQKIDELKTAFEEERLAEQGILPDKDQMNRIQMQIRKDYNSQIKPSELVDGLTEIFTLLKTKEKDLDAAAESAADLANAIVGEGGVLNDQTAKEYKALKEYMRKKPLLIMDEHKGDFGYNEWNRFRKANFGRLNLSKQGQTIDQFYPELLQLFPGLLDPSKTHPSDQLTHVLDVIKSLEPTFTNYDTESYVGREMVDILTIDILDFMYELDPKKPLGPARSRAKYLRILEKLEKATDEYSTMAETERADLRKYYEDKIANAETETERDNARARQERLDMIENYKRLMAEMKVERDKQIEILKAKGEEKLKKQADMYRERIDRTKARFMERRSRTQMMESIRDNADYLAEALVHPSDQKHIPEGYQHAIAALLSGLNFESTHTDAWEKRMGTPGKRVMNLRELQMYYLRMMANTENSEIEPDPEMASLLDLMTNEVDGRRLSELSNEEIANVRIILKSIRHTVSTINRTFNESIKENISELGDRIISDMRSGKYRKSHAGFTGTLDQYFNSQTVAPADFFAIAGGTLERMYYEVRKGFDRHVENSNQAMEYIKQAMDGINKKDVRKWSEKYGKAQTFTLQNGHEIRLLPSQVMSLYALNLREQARKHIYGSGIVVANLVAKKDKSMMKEVLESTHEMITYKDVQTIIGSLNDEQLSIANKLLRFITTTTSEWGNETSMKLYGYRKFTEENYFPIKSSDVFLDEVFESRSDAKIKNLGFTKNTVVNANNAVVIDDFFNVITDHITKMSMYNALVPALADFERVYNYKQKTDSVSTDSVQNSVVYGLGQNGKLYIKKLMQNINGYYNREYAAAWAEKFLSNYKKASLGLNLRVLVQQPTSLIRASMVIDQVYLLEGMAQKTIGHATRKEMWEHIPIARWKSWGYAQTDVSREQKDIMMGITNVMDTVTMGAYGWADDISWTVLYAAVKAETKGKHPDLVPDTPEYWEHIKDRFNQIVDRTQVVDSVFHRTEIMRDKTFFKKMLTSFMPEPLKMYNMLRTQIALAVKASSEGRHGDAAKMSIKIATSMIPYFAVLTAVQSIMDAVRRTWTGDDDDDEKTYLELFWAHFQDNLVDNLNPMTWLPFFRDVWSNISGFDVKRPDLAALMQISDDAKMLYNYITKDGDVSQNIFYISRKFAEDLSLLTGVPLKNFNREIESAALGVLAIMGFKQYSVYLKNKLKYQVVQEKGMFIDLYLKAEVSGSSKDAQAIYDDLKKSGITEKDITDRIKSNYGKAFREALDDELFGAAVRALDQMVSLGVSREDLVATVRSNIADPYKEAFASGDTAAMDGCHELLTAVGFTEADIKNYEYGTAKGYAKYQVYLVWQESGESAAWDEARRWIRKYPELYKNGVNAMMYGIENSADTTKANWDAGKWSRDSFDKFE